MKTNVICCICGTHKAVNGKLRARQYFPTKYVYNEKDVCITCDKCFDNYMIIENEDYINLLGKLPMNSDDKEFIRKSNEKYIESTLANLNVELMLEIEKGVTSSPIFNHPINRIKRSMDYWGTEKIINSKV